MIEDFFAGDHIQIAHHKRARYLSSVRHHRHQLMHHGNVRTSLFLFAILRSRLSSVYLIYLANGMERKSCQPLLNGPVIVK